MSRLEAELNDRGGVEHALSVRNGERPHLAGIVHAHRFLLQLPPVTLRLAAFGRAKGRRPGWVRAACDFTYRGASADGRIRFRAPRLRDVAPDVFTGQADLFRDAIDPDLTAFSLLAQGVRDVVDEDAESERIDPGFLRVFARLGDSLFEGASHLVLEGLQAESSSLELDHLAPQHARALLDRTPPPERVRVSGTLTLLRAKGASFEVTTREGVVRCALRHGEISSLGALFGGGVAVNGTAVFRPSGRLLRVDADVVERMRQGDDLFSRVPAALSLPQQLLDAQPTSSARGSWLRDVVGAWPGDEPLDELLAELRGA